MRTVLGYTDYHLPDQFLSIDEYFKELDDSIFQEINTNRNDLTSIYKNTYGIKGMYVGDRKNEAEIFSEMLEKYFSRENTTPEEIDFIIYTRGNSVAMGEIWAITEEKCINVPYFLHRKFKFTNAQVFNVEQECSCTLMSAKIAFSLIKDGSARKIILLSRNFFHHPEYRIMGGTSLVSDGLGMMEISIADSGLELIDFLAATDGSISRVRDYSKGINQSKVVQIGSNLIKSLVQKNNLTMKDISRIIPQNISKRVWTFYCQLLEIPKEKVFLDSFSDGAHMGDVDIIRNLTDFRKKNLLAKDEYIIAYAIGTGASWNALLLKAL